MVEEAEGAQVERLHQSKHLTAALVVLLVVCLSALAVCTYIILSRSNSGPPSVVELGEERPPMFEKPIGTFLVNLSPPDEYTIFSVDISFGCNQEQKKKLRLTIEEIDSRMSQIKHEINLILARQRRANLITEEGKERLGGEILREINKIFVEGQIDEVYFNSFFLREQ